MSHKYSIPPLTEETKNKILEGKTEQEQLGLRAHWALGDLAKFFEIREDPRYYRLNSLIRQLEYIWQGNDVSNKEVTANDNAPSHP